jgi:tRNA A37 threonylcarbamoyladenosine dehydratase
MDKEVQHKNDPKESQLELSMLISPYGVPVEIEVANAPQALTDKMLRDVRRELRDKRFRPKLVDGLAAEASLSMMYDQPTPKG